MRKLLMSVLVGVVMSASAFAGEGWLTNFDEAKKLAAKTGKPILADFSGSDWCGWCMKLENEVFSQKEFKDYAKDNLILLLVDYPQNKPQTEAVKKQNQAMMATYGIRGFPTVLLLNKDGKEIARTGYRQGGAKDYVKYLKTLIK